MLSSRKTWREKEGKCPKSSNLGQTAISSAASLHLASGAKVLIVHWQVYVSRVRRWIGGVLVSTYN